MTTGKNIALSRQTFVGKVMSLLFNMLSAAAAQSLQSCPTLCNPRDGSPPGSPVPRILQAKTLEWVAISFFMTNLDSILKSRDITLSNKVSLVKAMVFPVVIYGCENWTIKLTAEELMLKN